jgi:hypothetical protein
MSKKIMKELKMTITFKPSRAQDAHLARAYEIVMPSVRPHVIREKNDYQKNYLLQYKEELLS